MSSASRPDYYDLSWMDDMRLRVRSPYRSRHLSPNARAFIVLSLAAVLVGGLAALGWR
jgi:hypothetical protein